MVFEISFYVVRRGDNEKLATFRHTIEAFAVGTRIRAGYEVGELLPVQYYEGPAVDRESLVDAAVAAGVAVGNLVLEAASDRLEQLMKDRDGE